MHQKPITCPQLPSWPGALTPPTRSPGPAWAGARGARCCLSRDTTRGTNDALVAGRRQGGLGPEQGIPRGTVLQASLHGVRGWCRGPLSERTAHGLLVSGDGSQLWEPTGQKGGCSRGEGESSCVPGEEQGRLGLGRTSCPGPKPVRAPQRPGYTLGAWPEPALPTAALPAHPVSDPHRLTAPRQFSAGRVHPPLLASPHSSCETPLLSFLDWPLPRRSSCSLLWDPRALSPSVTALAPPGA